MIQLAVNISGQPPASGGSYTVNFSGAPVNFNSFLGTVTGNVTVKGAASGIRLLPLSVTAELSGTGNIIENVPTTSDASHFYTLELPAFPSSGTAYDIYVSGGGVTYGAAQNLLVTTGSLSSQDFTVTAGAVGGISGQVNDQCSAMIIPGASLELLAPAVPAGTPAPTPTASPSPCAMDPGNCVVVATAATDNNGFYPIAGTAQNPSGFAQIPVNQPNLAFRISASGYSSLLSSALLKSANVQTCSATTVANKCDFALETGYINGTMNLSTDPPPGNAVQVEVFAETSGTNQLVSALPQPLIFNHNQTSLPFTLNVPTTGAGPNFDLFAVAIDPFLGAPDPFPGHDIPVLANVAGPVTMFPGNPDCMTTNAPAFLPMVCEGHGSITGSVNNPDFGTTVEVEKDDPNNGMPVQILGTAPGQLSSTNISNPEDLITNQYTLCVPPDLYTLQRFEAAPTSSATASATPIPEGTPQPVTVPVPASTSSPCPSTCSSTDGGAEPCPGQCNATTANPL